MRPHYNPLRKALSPLFYSWENWGSETESDLCDGEAETQNRSSPDPKSHFFFPLRSVPRPANICWDGVLASLSSPQIQFQTALPQPTSSPLPKPFWAHQKLQECSGGGCHAVPRSHIKCSHLTAPHRTRCSFTSFSILEHGPTANWLERKPDLMAPCLPVKEESHFWHLKDLDLIHGRGLNEGGGEVGQRSDTP